MAIYRCARCPTLKTAGKQPQKEAEWAPVKQPVEQLKTLPEKAQTVKKTVLIGVSAVLGIWHLCRWPQRLEFSVLFSRRFQEGISFPNFVERSVLKLPLSKLCAVPLAVHHRAFLGGKGQKRCRDKEEEEGWPAERALDGPAIRNANRADSRESIRRKPLFS